MLTLCTWCVSLRTSKILSYTSEHIFNVLKQQKYSTIYVCFAFRVFFDSTTFPSPLYLPLCWDGTQDLTLARQVIPHPSCLLEWSEVASVGLDLLLWLKHAAGVGPTLLGCTLGTLLMESSAQFYQTPPDRLSRWLPNCMRVGIITVCENKAGEQSLYPLHTLLPHSVTAQDLM